MYPYLASLHTLKNICFSPSLIGKKTNDYTGNCKGKLRKGPGVHVLVRILVWQIETTASAITIKHNEEEKEDATELNEK